MCCNVYIGNLSKVIAWRDVLCMAAQNDDIKVVPGREIVVLLFLEPRPFHVVLLLYMYKLAHTHISFKRLNSA